MRLEGLGAAIQKAAADAVTEACGEVRDRARSLCPVESGTLKESIAMETGQEEGGAWGRVYAGADYGVLVELGTCKQSSKPFLQPAFAQIKGTVAAGIAKAIRSAI